MKERTNNWAVVAITALFFIAAASSTALFLIATEKVMINRPVPLGDYAALVDEQVEELPAHSLPEVKAGIKKWNDEVKNGKRN